jgi:hypothetical protein
MGIKRRVVEVNRFSEREQSERLHLERRPISTSFTSDSFRQSLVDSEAPAFHFGKERMNKSTAWLIFLALRQQSKIMRNVV